MNATATPIAWGARVEPALLARTVRMCIAFGWNWPGAAGDVLTCEAFETGRTFSPSVVNKAGSGATGLIQFMPQTAIDLGTTVQQLARMSAVQQMDYVEKYFRPYAKDVHNVKDMYLCILLPKYRSAPDDAVLFTDGTVAYRQNSGLDKNSDGQVTKLEVCTNILAMQAEGLRPGNVLAAA